MLAARNKERDYFLSSTEYGHLANKMGSEYLAKLLSKVKIFLDLFMHFNRSTSLFFHIDVFILYSCYCST